MYIAAFLIALLPGFPSADRAEVPVTVSVGADNTSFLWECPRPVSLETLPDGLDGFISPGCSFSGGDGQVLLPGKDLLLAVPSQDGLELEVIPEGVVSLGRATVARADVSSEGIDIFSAARAADVPSEWGRILDTGRFRRAGYVRVRLHPMVLRSGELLSARRLRVRLSYPEAGQSRPSRGLSGTVFEALFHGGNRVWETPPARQGASPFWGMPWYALEVDTAGVYRIECAHVPQAGGYPSSSLALFCGRGRDMGDSPWEEAYVPRPVPITVFDGGDGSFDQGDSFVFFGRGLAWWEADSLTMPGHYGHRYDTANTYWLTWGGEDGARMEVQNGQPTGAPQVPESFLARYHFEENTERCRESVPFPDEWAWLRSASSSDTWHYFNFQAPGATGEGYLRLNLASTEGIQHSIRILLNNVEMCDTTWSGTGFFQPTIEIDGISAGENSLALQIVRKTGTDIMYLDWFEVFPWTEGVSSDEFQVPLEWWPGYDRQAFSWQPGLEDRMVFLVGGDTLASRIDTDDPQVFEFEIPDSWASRELWIVDSSSMPVPSSISYESPGRIMGSLSGAQCVYLAADPFIDDIAPLAMRSGAEALAASEVYQEFNGGVRDPGAIRAMVHHMLESWTTIPSDLVLVGAGTWDPRNFSSSKTCYIDIQYTGATNIVSDDEFAMTGSSSLPQIAVSRIGTGNASDLQMIVDRSTRYRRGDNRGEWQTAVIGAADDERSPIHTSDERYHTQSVERLLTNWIPDVTRPEKLYLILYDWNSVWSKPEARTDYIDLWSRGALVSFYLGHGSFDQLADEGLLYLEDNGLLACGPRLPVALFGSCDVGRFQNPSVECLAQQITVSPVGGAILGMGATDKTSGPANETLLSQIFQHLFTQQDLSVGMSVLLGKIDAGYTLNHAQYILFGDGSLPLAYPWETFDIDVDTLRSGELNTITGSAPSGGLLMMEAWESCRRDTYYTFRQSLPIDYLSVPGRYYAGTAVAGPDFSADMFVPLDSDTGRTARTQVTFIDQDMIAAASTYPGRLVRGEPGGDDLGPEIELWIQGYRDESGPEVSGEVVARAVLSDSSGINLLGNPGRQLALYLDGTPTDVSDHFQYDRGSGTSGGLSFNLGVLDPGGHTLGLRASDGLLNVSQVEIEFSVTQDNSFGIFDVFPYPNPCSDGTSINWTQTSSGTVDISIYTVAGRRVRRFGNIQCEAGYNQYWWDCMDADGDAVASGAYIFVISASTISGTGDSSEVTGVIAVVRGS